MEVWTLDQIFEIQTYSLNGVKSLCVWFIKKIHIVPHLTTGALYFSPALHYLHRFCHQGYLSGPIFILYYLSPFGFTKEGNCEDNVFTHFHTMNAYNQSKGMKIWISTNSTGFSLIKRNLTFFNHWQTGHLKVTMLKIRIRRPFELFI